MAKTQKMNCGGKTKKMAAGGRAKKSSVESYLEAEEAAKWADEFAGMTAKKAKNTPAHMSPNPPRDIEQIKKYGRWAKEEAEAATLPNLSTNHVCAGCHAAYPPNYEIKWYRTPGGPLGVTVDSIWTEGFDGEKWIPQTEFAPNEAIHYKVRFTVTGAASSYFMKSPTASKAINQGGTAWSTALTKTGTLGPGTHEWTWSKTVPNTATPSTGAKVTVRINMKTSSGGTLLDYDVKSITFPCFIAPCP